MVADSGKTKYKSNVLQNCQVSLLSMQANSSSDPSETDGLVKVNKILTVIPVLFIILRA